MATYTRFSSDDIVITTEKVFTSTWTDNTNALASTANSHFGDLNNTAVSDAEYNSATSSLAFITNVYNGDATDTSNKIQYTISYGHKKGSGSLDYTSTDEGFSSARSIYGQFRSLVYGDENRNFTFNGYEPEDIYVLNVNRSLYKQSLRLGSLNLSVGSDTVLTDDSVTRSGSAVLTNIGRQYNIVSGSSGTMQGTDLSQTDSGSYGLFYPDAGIIILNPDALADSDIISESTLTTVRSFNSPNISVNSAYNIIRNAFAEYNTGLSYFELKAKEEIISQNYLIRIPNESYNYTNNQSFIDEKGKVKNLSFVDNPVTFITTIGLYNDQNELIAVAKLSKPLLKDFSKELFIKVKLDF